jgi:FMN reductase
MQALSVVLDSAREHNAEVRILDLRLANLPMYDPDSSGDHPAIKKVLDDVIWAEAFVLASPDYHGSVSGAVKNFLDYHWAEFSGKLFAYLCASHEKGLTVMDQMRTAVRHCYGWSLPYGVSVHGKEDFGIDGKIRHPHVQGRLRMAGRDLVTYGRLIRAQFNDDITNKAPETFAARYILNK